jgi:predicted porin
MENLPMKKTLIALAALASSAAFAQSSVTVYGLVDAGVFKSIGSDVTQLGSATASRVGFRGTEDLGGGLKANFTVENRFNPDTGAQANANAFWHGRSTVGLSGNFGSVDFGRALPAAFGTAAAADVFGWDGVAQNTVATAAGSPHSRFANGVFYTSPSLYGFSASVSYGLKETDARDAASGRLTYANGPFSADVAAERQANGFNYRAAGAAYNFGIATANGLIAKGKKLDGTESDSVVLGLVVPMGALTLKASYAQLEVGGVDTVSQIGVGARYALSKRTDLYTSFANNSKAAAEKSGLELGVTHKF